METISGSRSTIELRGNDEQIVCHQNDDNTISVFIHYVARNVNFEPVAEVLRKNFHLTRFEMDRICHLLIEMEEEKVLKDLRI